MLNAHEYHALKVNILMRKCRTHDEDEPCNEVCLAIDQVIDQVWQFSEMAEKTKAAE